jgi:hypothetical protein
MEAFELATFKALVEYFGTGLFTLVSASLELNYCLVTDESIEKYGHVEMSRGVGHLFWESEWFDHDGSRVKIKS